MIPPHGLGYGRRDLAVLGFVAGLLVGLITAFASCSPPEHQTYSPTTMEGHQ